jgi:putative transposase
MERYRIVEGIGIYFVTFTIVEWMPVFIEEATCKIITESLNFSIKNKRLGVNAYVIMPNHMHAIVFDKDFDNERLKHTLHDLRKFTGRQLLDYADANLPNPFGQTFRENAKEDRQRKFWQSTQHPEGIFTERFYRQKFNYIHLNPVRKGLVRSAVDWRFSSAGYWLDTAAGQETSGEQSQETSGEQSQETSGEQTSGKRGVERGSPDPRRFPNDVELSAIGWE